jgi:hypothetical protein
MAMVLAIEPPDVSWVWKCTGSDVTCTPHTWLG